MTTIKQLVHFLFFFQFDPIGSHRNLMESIRVCVCVSRTEQNKENVLKRKQKL